MNKVKLDEITYPYVNIYVLDGQEENIGKNLQKVYLYIDQHTNMGSRFQYGNAYRAIRVKANSLIGRKDVRVSKREVSALVRCRSNIFCKKYIKIPYKMYFIFKAIFEIVDELKTQYPLPPEVKCFVGKIRRESFYEIQSELYRKWYRDHEDYLTRALYNEIFAGNSILSEKF